MTEFNPKNVIEQIEKSGVQMHSRKFFVLRMIAKVALLVLAILFAIYITSFILYFMSSNGSLHLTSFGVRGLKDLVLSLPLLILLMSVLGIIAVLLISARYQFSYRRPAIYSLSIVVGTVVVTSIIVAQTPIHSGVNSFLRANQFGQMIPRQYLQPELARLHHGLIGEIVAITQEGLIVHTPDSRIIHINVSQDLENEQSVMPDLGDKIFISGREHEDIIDVDDIIILEKNMK